MSYSISVVNLWKASKSWGDWVNSVTSLGYVTRP
jgi:hypothetical protein